MARASIPDIRHPRTWTIPLIPNHR